MRLFVAVYPPPAILDHLGSAVDRLGVCRAAADGVNTRLASRAQWHVTLAFLGEVADERLPDVTGALSLAVTSWRTPTGGGARRARRDASRLARTTPAVAVPALPSAPSSPHGGGPSAGAVRAAPTLCVAGGGRFGRGRFTVLWAGIGGDVPALTSLAVDIRRHLKRARLPFDDKPLRPHLTIARPGDRVDREVVVADVEALRGYRGPEWTVESVELVRSHMGPKPTYDRLATWPL